MSYGYFKIIDTDKGSIKITLQGTPEDCDTIINLFNSGELIEISNIPIASIQSITPQREKEIEEKRTIIDRIREGNLDSRDLIGINLVGADLSNANLQGLNFTDCDLMLANLENAILENTNFTNVDLTNIDLTGANLKGTIFKDNKGLDRATKEDLINRGSIFKDTINLGDRGSSFVTSSEVTTPLAGLQNYVKGAEVVHFGSDAALENQEVVLH